MSDFDLIHIESALWLLTADIGNPNYDFDFRNCFVCRHPWERREHVRAVARTGAFGDYAARYAELLADRVQLVNSPEEYLGATELPHWYPVLSDLTPRSIWFDTPPDAAEIGRELGWPIFVKGARQTSRHKRSLSIIENPEAFSRAMEGLQSDPILKWQRVVCREYVALRAVEDRVPDRIPSSFEFRTFWWKSRLVGCGRYWWEGAPYDLAVRERPAALAVAEEAAKRVGVPFLVVDIAQTVDGNWIVIECNDGQESGYAGVSPFTLWQNIIDIEKTREML